MKARVSALPFSVFLVLALTWQATPAQARKCPAGYRSQGKRCVRAGGVRRPTPRRPAPARVRPTPRRPAPARVAPCPAGTYRSGGRCIRRATVRHGGGRVAPCPGGYYRSGGRCIRRGGVHVAPCPGGYYRSGGRCVRRGGVIHRRAACPGGYYRNSFGSCVRFRGTVRTCSPGWRWSGYYRRCVRHVTHTRCGPGTVWNGYYCRRWQTCPTGYYYSQYYKSCRARVATCPYGYRYRPGWGCRRICPVGWYFSSGSCHRSTVACPPGQFYNYGTRSCRTRCRAGYYWSFRRHRCRRVRW